MYCSLFSSVLYRRWYCTFEVVLQIFFLERRIGGRGRSRTSSSLRKRFKIVNRIKTKIGKRDNYNEDEHGNGIGNKLKHGNKMVIKMKKTKKGRREGDQADVPACPY
jgi:hypothetical protein